MTIDILIIGEWQSLQSIQLGPAKAQEWVISVTFFEDIMPAIKVIDIFWFEYEKKLIVFLIYPTSEIWMENFQKVFDPIVQFVQPGSHFEARNRQEGSPPFVSRGLYYT